MEAESSRPVMSKRLKGRDWHRFDNAGSFQTCVGRGSIGKVEVDCRFLFTKSRWGFLGNQPRVPAGIVYLDLDFRQPPGCKLVSATVSVTLTDETGKQSRIKPRYPYATKFTGHYGPPNLRGRETPMQTKKIKNFTPEVQVMGYGAGGLGVEKEKTVRTAGRWQFSGHMSSEDGKWHDKLQWVLEENSLDFQPTHSNIFHTAFAMEHNATRFFMTVHVSGQLAKTSDKVKKWFKFGTKDQGIMTSIQWAHDYPHVLPLDIWANKLNYAMELENMAAIPAEMPSALPVTFRPVAQPERPSLQPATVPLLNAPSGREQQQLTLTNATPYLSEPTMDELSMVSGFGTSPLAILLTLPPPEQTHQRPITTPQSSQESDFGGSGTLVNSAVEPETAVCRDNDGKETWTETMKKIGLSDGGITSSLWLDWLWNVAPLLLSVLGLMVSFVKTTAVEDGRVYTKSREE